MVETSQMKRQQKLTKPMKAYTSVWFSGVGQSWTPETFTGSILTLFSEMTSPRYSICFRWNSHFSGQRNNLCSVSTSKTLQTARSCSSSIFIKIRMLSKYTTTIPLVMRVLKMSFIIVWKVAVRATRAEHSRRFLSLNYAIEWVTTHLQEIPQRIR